VCARAYAYIFKKNTCMCVPVDSALDKDESEFAVLVLLVALQVLADRHGLLDQHVQILGNLGGEASLLEDAKDLVASHRLDLCDAVAVPQDDTDLRGCKTFLSELGYVVLDLGGGEFEP